MKTKFIIITVVFSFFVYVQGQVTENNYPSVLRFVKKQDKKIQSVIQSNVDSVQKKERLAKIVDRFFDLKTLAKKSLGRKEFNSLTEDQKKEFLRKFARMVLLSSVDKIQRYVPDSVTYEEPIYRQNKATLVSLNYKNDEETVLKYKLHYKNNQWKAWDLITDDLSTYRSYREQFRRILKEKSFQDLMDVINKKLNKLEKKG